MFVGAVAKVIAKIFKASKAAATKGRVIVIYHKHPDVEEIQLALDQVSSDATTVVEGSRVAMLETLLAKGHENVLVTDAHKLPLAFQLDHSLTRWPAGWIFLTPKPPKELAKNGGHWAISFSKNTVKCAIAWKNFQERPWRDIVFQIKITITRAGIEVPNGLLEDNMQGLTLDQVNGVNEVAAIAETMIASTRQGKRRTLAPMDIVAGMTLKDSSTASPETTAASLAKKNLLIPDEHDDDHYHIDAQTTARLLRLEGSRGGRRNSTYFLN